MEHNTWIFALEGRLSCCKDDKIPVFRTVKKLVEYIKLVRRDGLLALANTMVTEKDLFLKSCLRYFLEVSPEPEDFAEYGTICLTAATETGAQLLHKAVIVDGLLLLLRQTSPRTAFLRLAPWLGGDFSEEVEAELLAIDEAEKRRNRELRETRAVSVIPEFDALAGLSDEQLLSIKEIDSQTLTIALMGASGAVYSKVKRSFPSAQWEELERMMDVLHPLRACDAEYAQQRLLELLTGRGKVL